MRLRDFGILALCSLILLGASVPGPPSSSESASTDPCVIAGLTSAECLAVRDVDEDGDVCDEARTAYFDRAYPVAQRAAVTYTREITSIVTGADIVGEIGDLSGRQIIPGTIRIYDESTTPQVITDVGTVVNSVGALTGDLGAASTTQHTDADLGTCSALVPGDTLCSTQLAGTGSLVTPVIWDSLSMTLDGTKTFTFDSLFTDTGGVSGLSLESTDPDYKNLVLFGEFGVDWVSGKSEWSDDTDRGLGVPLTATYQSGVDNRMGYEFGGEAINARFAAPAVGTVTFEYQAYPDPRALIGETVHLYFQEGVGTIPCKSPLKVCGGERGDLPSGQSLPSCSGATGSTFTTDAEDLPGLALHFGEATTIACDLDEVTLGAGRWACIQVGDAATDGTRASSSEWLIPLKITGDPILTMADVDDFGSSQQFTGLWMNGVLSGDVKMTIRELAPGGIGIGAVIVAPDSYANLTVETTETSSPSIPLVLLDGRTDGLVVEGKGAVLKIGSDGARAAPANVEDTWGDGGGCRYGGTSNQDNHNCSDFTVSWEGSSVKVTEFSGLSRISGTLAAESDECVEFIPTISEDGVNISGFVVVDVACTSGSSSGHVRVHAQGGNFVSDSGPNPDPVVLDGTIIVRGAYETDGADEFAMGLDSGALSGDSNSKLPSANLRIQDGGVAVVGGRRYRQDPTGTAGSGATHSGHVQILGSHVDTFELDSLAAPGVGTTRCLPWGDRNATFVDCAAPEAKLTSSEALFLNRWRLELLSDVASTNELCEITPLCDGSPVDDGWTAQSVHVSQVGGPGLRNQGDVEEFWLAEYCSDGKVLTLEVQEPGVRGASATTCEAGSSCDCTTLDLLLEVETAKFPN